MSGKVEEGETAERAAVREASEELGIEPMDISLIRHLHDTKHNHSDGFLREFYVFSAKVDSTLIEKMKLEPNEVEAVKWVSLDNLRKVYEQNPETIIIASNSALWQEIFENLEFAVDEI